MPLFAIYRDVFPREGQDVVEQFPVRCTETVGGFLVLAFRKHGVGLEVTADVTAAALHEVTGEPPPGAFAPGAVQVCRQVGELLVEQAQQGTERILIATVRRCRDQQDVPLRIGGHAA